MPITVLRPFGEGESRFVLVQNRESVIVPRPTNDAGVVNAGEGCASSAHEASRRFNPSDLPYSPGRAAGAVATGSAARRPVRSSPADTGMSTAMGAAASVISPTTTKAALKSLIIGSA